MFSAVIRPGLELRPLEERHTPALFALVNCQREYLREWLQWVDVTSNEEQLLAFIRRSLDQFASNGGLTAGIWEQARLIGVIGTHPIDWINRKAEVGYWLGREFQGRGIVTDACRAMVKHLLVELELNRVEIHCAAGNGRSIAVPKRLGFTFEGTRREAQLLNGRFVDLEVYSLLRSELSAASGSRP